MQATLRYQYDATLGESPVWDERINRLYWVDILGSTLHHYDPATETNMTHDIGAHVGCVILTTDPDIVLLAIQSQVARFHLPTQTLTTVASLPIEADTTPRKRFNDGAVSPAGTFYVGNMAYDVTPKAGTLYRYDEEQHFKAVKQGLTITNGIAWTADHTTLYHVDSEPGIIWAYDYDISADTLNNARIVVDVPEAMGKPDGIALDVDGNLWVAHWGYSKVVCWSMATGHVLSEINVPADNVTSCAFGGDDMKTLYITTAREGVSDDRLQMTPHAGSIFSVVMPIAGLPAHRFQLNTDGD